MLPNSPRKHPNSVDDTKNQTVFGTDLVSQLQDAITNADPAAIIILLAQIKDITVLMSMLTKSVRGLDIYNELSKHATFCKLLESLPRDPPGFSRLISNTLQQGNHKFTKQLIKLLASICAQASNKDLYVFYDCVLHCQCVVQAYDISGEDFNQRLEAIKIIMLGMDAYEVLLWLKRENYIKAFAAVKKIQKSHILAIVLKNEAIKMVQHSKQLLEEAIRLCDPSQVVDYVSLLMAYSKHILADDTQSIAKKNEFIASFVNAIKKAPLANNLANIQILIKWLKQQYKYLVQQAKVDPDNKRKLLTEAKKVKAEMVHYVNQAFFVLFESPQPKIIKDILFIEQSILFLEKYLLLIHRNPAREIFIVLMDFVKNSPDKLLTMHNICVHNVQMLQSLLRTFFHDESYRPEIKVQIFNQILKFLAMALNNVVNNKYSTLFQDLIIDLNQIISDVEVYNNDLLSLKNKIRYFGAIPHKEFMLSRSSSYFEERDSVASRFFSGVTTARAKQNLEDKINDLLSLLEKETSTTICENSEKINNLTNRLKELLINEKVHVGVECIHRMLNIAKKLAEFELYKSGLRTIKIILDLAPEYNYELINPALLVQKQILVATEKLDKAKITRLTACNLALNEYYQFFYKEVAADRVNSNVGLMINRHHDLQPLLRGLNLPYFAEFYELFKLFIKNFANLDITLFKMTVLLHSIEYQLAMLPHKLINMVLNQTYQILDIYLLQLLQEQGENSNIDIKCQLLDFIMNLQIILSRLDINNQVRNENNVTGDITINLYAAKTWQNPATKIISLRLSEINREIKKLKQESYRCFGNTTELATCLDSLWELYRQRVCFYQVAEIVNSFVLMLRARSNYKTMVSLSYFINQFYYQCRIDMADKIDYFMWFKNLAAKVFDLMLINDEIDCDSILLLDSIIENIDAYLVKLNLQLSAEVAEQSGLRATLKPCVN